MGYLDNAGLQHLWDRLKEKFAQKSHSHDDRYYTESEMDAKLSAKAANIVLAHNANLNDVTTPGFYSCGGGNSILNKPTGVDAIGLIVTHNASGNYYTQILTTSSNANTYRRTCLNGSWSGWTQDKYTDTNTWRGIQNNLTSDSTSDSLSAAQGKVLKGLVDGKANSSHTHTKSQITDFPISLKNPTALTIQTNGTTAATYDGSAAKTVNITKGNIGLGNVDNTADADKSVKYAISAGSASTATKLSSNAGSNTQPVYFSDGKPVVIGYTIASSVPANAKFTDTTYGVATASSNGLMSSTDKIKLDDFSRVISIQKQIKLTTDWQDTGIAGTSLDTGTYVVQVSGFNSSYTSLYGEIYSGIMTWYSGGTNSGNSSEIFLHNAGHADNNNAIYLRTLRTASGGSLKLQIACKTAATKAKLVEWQKAHGLADDGICGMATWNSF